MALANKVIRISINKLAVMKNSLDFHGGPDVQHVALLTKDIKQPEG